MSRTISLVICLTDLRSDLSQQGDVCLVLQYRPGPSFRFSIYLANFPDLLQAGKCDLTISFLPLVYLVKHTQSPPIPSAGFKCRTIDVVNDFKGKVPRVMHGAKCCKIKDPLNM